METYLEDVLSQPASLQQCVEGLYQPLLMEKLHVICQRSYSNVIFTGMGSSNYCSISADALLKRNGKSCFRYSTSELIHYHLNVIRPDTLVVINSQSGESAEIIKLLEHLSNDIVTIAVCNNSESPLAQKATLFLPMNSEPEESVTTRTYLASIVIDILIAKTYLGLSYRDYLLSVLEMSSNMETFFKDVSLVDAALKNSIGFPPQLCLIGRGCSTATTKSGALFLREIACYPAFSELGGEFRHGPMEMVHEHFYGIVVAANDATTGLAHKMTAEIQEHGGHVVAISNENWLDVPTIVVPETEEWLSPLVTILPIQLYADSLAKQKGRRAGSFRWGSKITREE